MAITDNDLLIAHIHKINTEITGQALHRLETWLKFAADKPTNLPEEFDLDTARENWEQVLIWLEDALLAALLTNDWNDVYSTIQQLQHQEKVQTNTASKFQEYLDSQQEQNLDATFDLAFQRD
jgi:hypothetical protein